MKGNLLLTLASAEKNISPLYQVYFILHLYVIGIRYNIRRQKGI